MAEDKKKSDPETTEDLPLYANLDFTRQEAGLLLAIVHAAWRAPLGDRGTAELLGKIEDKLIAAKVPTGPALS